MPKLKIRLPKEVQTLPEEIRKEILLQVQKALNIDSPSSSPKSVEHNMWARNTDPLLADVEDEMYEALVTPAMESIAVLFSALNLPTEDLDLSKAFSAEYYTLQKSKNGKWKEFFQFLREKAKQGAKALLDFATQKGKAWTKEQLKKIDEILSIPQQTSMDLVEQFITRMGYLAKLRQEADAQGLIIQRAELPEFPKTIATGEVTPLDVKVKAKDPKGQKVTVTLQIPPFTPSEAEHLRIAEAHCASKIKEISERHREQVKQLVIRALKEHWSPRQLAQTLVDTFGDHNRDWRRVALTELAMAQNDVYLASCEEGAKVYVSPVPGTCKHCQRLIDGKTFIVSHKPELDKEMTHVWPGKSNFGRKAKDYVPCAPLHPYCRHRYHRLNPLYKMEDGKPVPKTQEEVMQEIQENLKRKEETQ